MRASTLSCASEGERASEAETPKRRKRRRRRDPNAPKRATPEAFLKPLSLSPELQAVAGGATELPRSQVIKQVWVYIKANKLQDPNDGRVVLPDEKLAAVLGTREPLHMTKLMKPVFSHLTSKDE